MPLIYFLIILFYQQHLSAQDLNKAKVLADSATFLIYEDIDLVLAKKLNQEAAAIYAQTKNNQGQAYCQFNTASLLAQKDSFALGLKLIQEITKKIPATISDTSELAALIWTAESWCLWGLARYTEAYQIATKASKILYSNQNWERFVNASIIATYAIYYSNEDDFNSIDYHMEETYQTALKHLPNNRFVFKYIYQLYGAILSQQGRIDKAILISQQGLKYETKLLEENHFKKDSSIVAKYYSNLGRMYSKIEDIEQSIIYYKNAFTFYHELNNFPELIKLSVRLGELYELTQNEEESDLYYSKIPYYIPTISKNPLTQQREHNYEHVAMGYYYTHFNLNDSTLHYYNEHINYIKQHDLAVDKAYVNIANAFEALGNYQKAGDFFKKALILQQKKFGNQGTKIASTYFKLGELAAKSGNNHKAVSYMDSVINILYTSPMSQEDKIQFLEFMLDKSIAMEAYHQRGNVHLETGQLQKAHDDFNQVILLANYLRDNYIDSDSKLFSVNKLRPVYEKAAAAAWHLHEKKQDDFYKTVIFNYAEHSKSTLLNESISKFRNNYKQGGFGIPAELLAQEEKFISQIDQCKEHILESKKEQNNKKEAAFLAKLLKLEQGLDSLEQVLQATYPSYRTWDHGRDSMVTIQDVQAYLKSDELFVEYFISDNHFFIIYISKDQVKIKDVPYNRKVYLSKIRNLRRSLSDINFILESEQDAFEVFCGEAQWFFNNFFKDELLKGKKHLIIVPDRYLHYIPFEVLLSQPPVNKQNIDYQSLQYLIKDYSIHYEYSAAMMVHAQTDLNTNNGKILAFGATYGHQQDYKTMPAYLQKERTADETKMHNTATEIPGTLDELKTLSRYFEGDYFLDKEANERQFKKMLNQSEYSILHLAMHGMVDFSHPAYSSLLFTENLDSLEDNLLYSYETQHLNGKNVNLVVLSACKTGYGQYSEGEGIISLGRSFMYAGVPSVVMTLWEINDQTSVEIMQFFYANLVKGQAKHEAMRNAKLSYIKANSGFTAHPFFWGSLISIGNQQQIPLAHRPSTWYWWLLGVVAVLGVGRVVYLKTS